MRIVGGSRVVPVVPGWPGFFLLLILQGIPPSFFKYRKNLGQLGQMPKMTSKTGTELGQNWDSCLMQPQMGTPTCSVSVWCLGGSGPTATPPLRDWDEKLLHL